MTTEEEYNKLAMEAQYLQQQMQEMQRQLQQGIMIQSGIDSTVKTIDGMKGVKNETFFQIGSGAFIKGRANDGKGILVDVGAGMFVEKAPEDAKVLLLDRKDKIEKAIEMLKKNLAQLTKRLQEIDAQVSQMEGQ